MSSKTAPAGKDKLRPGKTSVCLLGGRKMLQHAMGSFLSAKGFDVKIFQADEILDAGWPSLACHQCRVLVLIIAGSGPFRTFYAIRQLLERTERAIPLVILSDKASRGNVYAAMRLGAKAYVDLDSEPEELIKAIRSAVVGRAYLSPVLAALVVGELTTAGESLTVKRLPHGELTRRELDIVQLLSDGLSSKQIAGRLHISAKTVENHRYNIYRKCAVDNIAGLIRHAIQHGMVSI